MSFKETVARVYRETVETYHGVPAARAEVFETAAAAILTDVRAGRLQIDAEAAVHAALLDADAADKRAADRVLARAARGEVMLTDDDLDLVVALGHGMRKQWRDVTPADLDAMNFQRFENYRKVREAYQVFNADLLMVRPIVERFRTFGAAQAAGGFPPAPTTGEAAA